MENIGGIGNSSFDLKINGQQQNTASAILRINQVLQGEVLQLLDGQTIVLGVGQYRVPAQSHVELKLGDKFQFQVVQEGDEIVLKILPDQQRQQPKNSFELFQRAAGQDRSINEVIGKLAEVLLVLSESSNASSASQSKVPRETLEFLREVIQSLPKEQLAKLREQLRTPTQNQSQKPVPTPIPVPGASSPFPLSNAGLPTTPNTAPVPDPAGLSAQQGQPNLPTETAAAEKPGPTPMNNSSTPLPTGAGPQPASSSTAPTQSSPAQPSATTGPQFSLPSQVGGSEPAKQANAEATPQKPWLSLLPRDVAGLLAPKLATQVQDLVKWIQKTVVREDASVEKIRKNVEQAGVPLESRMRQMLAEKNTQPLPQLATRDLKTMLAGLEKEVERVLDQMKTLSEPSSEKTIRELLHTVRESREAVESKQLQNALRQDLREALHFQVPFQEAQQLRTADLFYKRGRSQDKEGKQSDLHHMVFLLEMSQLGPMRVDAVMKEKNLDLFLRFEDPKAAEYVRSQLSGLAQTLNAIGFQVGMLECAGGLKKQEQKKAESLDLPVLHERRLLDLEG